MKASPKCLTNFEAEKFLETIQEHAETRTGKEKATRNYIMALFMLDAGLRVSELCQLRKSDIWFEKEPTRSVTIRHDNDRKCRERTIPLSDRLKQAIINWHGCWYPKDLTKSSYYVFPSEDITKTITPRQVERIISDTAMAAFGHKINPHMLRHTFADRLRRKVDIRTLQKLLGHRHLSSTQIYTHPSQQDCEDAINSLNGG